MQARYLLSRVFLFVCPLCHIGSLYQMTQLSDCHWCLFVVLSDLRRQNSDGINSTDWINLQFLINFYPRDAMLARVIVIATRSSVRLSVCPSVTRRYCVKTKKASGMISSPSGSPKTLVFWRQISSPNSKGFPRIGASKKGRSEK